MALDRIYGEFQTAGVKVTTAAKSQINNLGTDGYAQAVVVVDADGAVVPSGYLSRNITTNATTLVKTGAGVFRGFSVNTVGVTSSLVIYDSLTATGTKIGTYSTLAQGAVIIDAAVAIGITAVTAGGTPADITILYR